MPQTQQYSPDADNMAEIKDKKNTAQESDAQENNQNFQKKSLEEKLDTMNEREMEAETAKKETGKKLDKKIADSGEEKTAESFASLFEESFGSEKNIVGSVLAGKVVAIENEQAVIDVGLKTEGRVSVKEFAVGDQPNIPKPGEIVDVFIERLEDRNGEIQISREKVRREEAWQKLEVFFKQEKNVIGKISAVVKGGFTVDLGDADAFLPGSLVDIRPTKDNADIVKIEQEFQILKMDRARNNIVVSRRAILEKERAGQRKELIENLEEGRVMEGIVKNITDYGAFIDLGGIDGLLHVTDMSWKRVSNPRDFVEVGDSIKVKIIRYNAETQRVSLGIKQMEKNPWEQVADKYPVDTKVKGKVTRVTDYGAFVELEMGVEGLVHVSEMSWMRKNIHPSKIVSVSEEVEVQILEIDMEKKRISLGMKSCQPNPWTAFSEKYKVGDEIQGTVKNTAEFGLFLTLPLEADGMVHITDLVWSGSPDEALKSYKRGDEVKVKILEINIKKERVSLGIKQLLQDPFVETVEKIKEGDVVTCNVVKIQDSGILVNFSPGEGEKIEAFVKRADLARNKADQRPNRYAAGEKVDAQITAIDKKQRRVYLSIKAREVAEVEEVKSTYGSSDSGAVLGDILGKAIEEKQAQEESLVEAKAQKKNKEKKEPKQKLEQKNDEAEKQKETQVKAEQKNPEAEDSSKTEDKKNAETDTSEPDAEQT